ncbi:Maf family protein [Jannaschia seohaensis]|uniref:dTTP/UTP pyrophosphatase n=1 Tax=Jannaschia seohaensis TaxID=475081 RepID=A0A2Y9B021_9RHOB|nr:Maf family protein [Jannaschia seohaensis]PWJ15001.1 septum formation protein [Jannaschia seohaensis]SSA49850.1 septum formation protein [Jannaschia seohaensis]
MLILGSGSPRRSELLAQLGLTPDAVRPPEIDETPLPGELPRRYCERITAAKLAAVEADSEDIVLCADTTVAVGRRILGKAADPEEAAAFLRLLSGRRHKVITCIAVRRGSAAWHRTSVSSVRLKRLSEREIAGYLATGDWKGKAGAYAIQGPAAAFVAWIEGSHSGIVGLPLHETATLLQQAGLEIWK